MTTEQQQNTINNIIGHMSGINGLKKEEIVNPNCVTGIELMDD